MEQVEEEKAVKKLKAVAIEQKLMGRKRSKRHRTTFLATQRLWQVGWGARPTSCCT